MTTTTMTIILANDMYRRGAGRAVAARGVRKFGLAVTAALVMSLQVGPAFAWDPATTQAGLTERALLASSFHKILAERLGRPLGALEPLALHSRLWPGELRQSIWERLARLDPAGGYRPDADGVNTAFNWVAAGAVLAETPPERGRNHFLDPRTGRGLDDGAGLAGTMHALRLGIDAGGSVRGLATGTTFDLTGPASLDWLTSPENDLGLPVFEAQIGKAVSAAEPVEREAALVRALLSLGGLLAVLEDAGEPAHVRNDFRGSYLERQGPSGWDRGSRFERFVAERYGRAGVPKPSATVTRPDLRSFFTAGDGQGLADRTQRRFFSDGTVPDEIRVEPSNTPQQIVEMARASMRLPEPSFSRLELRRTGRQYVTQQGRRVLGYERQPEGVRFFLDEAIYLDTSKVLLPEVASYAAGFVDHLFRARAVFDFEAGKVSVKLEGLRGDAAEGRLVLYAEDAGGRRQAIAGADEVRKLASGEVVAASLPAGTRRVAAHFTGADAAGTLIVAGEAAVR